MWVLKVGITTNQMQVGVSCEEKLGFSQQWFVYKGFFTVSYIVKSRQLFFLIQEQDSSTMITIGKVNSIDMNKQTFWKREYITL